MVGVKGIVIGLCLGLLPLSAMGQGQAYWLPPAAGGGVAPSSPYTSGFSVQPQSFYSGAGAVSAPPSRPVCHAETCRSRSASSELARSKQQASWKQGPFAELKRSVCTETLTLKQ